MFDNPNPYLRTNTGDVVRLKSGGPPMTVTSLCPPGELIVHCEWFAGDNLKRDAFDATNLLNVSA